jgi:hypothetical protein
MELVHEEKHRNRPFGIPQPVDRGDGVAPGEIEVDHDGLGAQSRRERIGRRRIGCSVNLVAHGSERGFYPAPE